MAVSSVPKRPGISPGKERRESLRAAASRPSRVVSGKSSASAAATHYVFLSYARLDDELARQLVERLRAAGVIVKWDRDLLGGVDFQSELLSVLEGSGATIVLWSDAAVASRFVRDEANRAIDAGKLVSSHVSGFDLRKLPLGFGASQCIPVDDFEKLLASLAAFGVVPAEPTAV